MEYNFPDVVLREVFRHLGARDVWAAAQVSRRWRLIGTASRSEVSTMRVSDFYKDLLDEECHVEYPVFHRREDLSGLILVRNGTIKILLKWLRKLFPNISELVFRNYVRRVNCSRPIRHPSRYHVFVINELMTCVGHLWPRLEMLDVSGEVVDVRSLHQVKHWVNFREVRLSGCDLSYNMLPSKFLVAQALTKTFWPFPLGALRLSNLEMKFDMTFTKMTMFKVRSFLFLICENRSHSGV